MLTVSDFGLLNEDESESGQRGPDVYSVGKLIEMLAAGESLRPSPIDDTSVWEERLRCVESELRRQLQILYQSTDGFELVDACNDFDEDQPLEDSFLELKPVSDHVDVRRKLLSRFLYKEKVTVVQPNCVEAPASSGDLDWFLVDADASRDIALVSADLTSEFSSMRNQARTILLPSRTSRLVQISNELTSRLSLRQTADVKSQSNIPVNTNSLFDSLANLTTTSTWTSCNVCGEFMKRFDRRRDCSLCGERVCGDSHCFRSSYDVSQKALAHGVRQMCSPSPQLGAIVKMGRQGRTTNVHSRGEIKNLCACCVDSLEFFTTSGRLALGRRSAPQPAAVQLAERCRLLHAANLDATRHLITQLHNSHPQNVSPGQQRLLQSIGQALHHRLLMNKKKICN